jgi:hypothetical protein
MQETVLLTCLIVGSLGFVLWYSRSSSLRLPVRFQIMYDSNPPYIHRIFRRRLLAVILYFLIPWLVFAKCGYPLHSVMYQLDIGFDWSRSIAICTSIGILIAFILAYINTKQDAGLEAYPEMRIRFWTPYIFFVSISSWIGYIFAYELFYRGFLFHVLLYFFPDSLAIPIVGTTALYTLTHYWKLNRISTFSFIWSPLACYMVYWLHSMWPAILIHLSLSLFFEWWAIKKHPEMHAQRT